MLDQLDLHNDMVIGLLRMCMFVSECLRYLPFFNCNKIAVRNGQFSETPAAGKWFNTWYKWFMNVYSVHSDI